MSQPTAEEKQPTTTDVAVKKQPGRPRKRPIILPTSVLGLVSKPLNDENRIEIICQIPSLFKKLSTMFKAMSIPEVTLYFNEQDIKSYANDHMEKSTLFITFHGAKLMRFFCSTPTIAKFKRERLADITRKFNRQYNQFSFIMKNHTYQNTLYIQTDIKDANTEFQGLHPIELISTTDSRVIEEPTDDYPMKFAIPTSLLKNFIAGTNSNSTSLAFEKVGNESLTIYMRHLNKNLETYTFPNESKIILKSIISPEDIFSASVYVIGIKSFISAHLSDTIYISADINKRMIFAYKTPLFDIKLYIDIIKSETPTVETSVR